MPYIKNDRRHIYNTLVEEFQDEWERGDFHPGEMNYFIFKLLDSSWRLDTSYDNANELMGVLACVSQEWYRRRVAPYEDLKKEENGDV